MTIEEARFGPILYMEFRFSVIPFISGNHTHVSVKRGKRSIRVMTDAACMQSIGIQMNARQACAAINWEMPDYCLMDIVSYNVQADGDNLRKPLQDALQGIVFPTDARILDDSRKRCKDKGPSRILVAVQAVHGKPYGYGKPSKRQQSNKLSQKGKR